MELHGMYIAVGKQGEGKTLLITKFAFKNKEINPNRPIFSNYKLIGVEYTPITFNTDIEENKDKLDFIEALKTNPSQFNDSIILLDEIHLYLDSLDYRKETSRVVQTFVSQLRKRNILLLGTTQYWLNLSIRVRRQAMAVFDVSKIIKNGRLLFNVATGVVDGYYYDLITDVDMDLSEYFGKYDTKEVIL